MPTREIRDQRLIARDFRKCKSDESRHRNRVQKTFNALGLRLSAIFSNFTGKAATAILDAWSDGVDNLKEVVEIKGGRLKAGTEAILEMLSKAIPEIVMRTFANSGNTLHTCRKEPTTSWRRCARLNNLIRSRLIC